MRNEPEDWGNEFCCLLEEHELLCEQLCGNSKKLRDTLIERRFTEVNTTLVELQKLNQMLSNHTLKVTTAARAHGLIAANEELKLFRLLNHEKINDFPFLRKQLVSVTKAVQLTAREAELNKRLFNRLLDWNRKEACIVSELLTEKSGYGARGAMKEIKPRPAMLDRRG